MIDTNAFTVEREVVRSWVSGSLSTIKTCSPDATLINFPQQDFIIFSSTILVMNFEKFKIDTVIRAVAWKKCTFYLCYYDPIDGS